MSFVSTSPAELAGTDLKPLPDGRYRVTVREAMPAGFKVNNDALTAYGTLIDKPITGKYTFAAAAYLIDQDYVSQDGGVLRVRIYETLHATAEVQVGKLTFYLDADGRGRARGQFLQLASATRTPGTPGTTAAPDASTYILETEVAENDGAVRRITRTYTQTVASSGTAEAVGPIVISYPFNALGDTAHVVASQVYEQPATHYAPLALNATRTVSVGGTNQTLYFVGDELPPSRQGATLLRFTRRWANKPSAWSEYETIACTFPGIGATTAEWAAIRNGSIFITWRRDGFTKVVPSKVTYTYYRIASSGGDYTSAESIPLDTVQTYALTSNGSTPILSNTRAPTNIYLSDVDTLCNGNSCFVDLLTIPTRTQYFNLGAFGLVVSSEYRRYMGNIYVRITRSVTPI